MSVYIECLCRDNSSTSGSVVWSKSVLVIVVSWCISSLVDEGEMGVRRFMREVVTQWRSLSMEVRSVRSMLEEVLSNWDRYSSTVASLQAWLEDAEEALSQQENTKRVCDWLFVGPPTIFLISFLVHRLKVPLHVHLFDGLKSLGITIRCTPA